jgi:hypothetical protein
MSVVHSEGTPSGSSPFQSVKSRVDITAESAKLMLEDIDKFPVAATGHSFKSFLSKARHVAAKVQKGIGKAAKIAALVEKAL